MYAELRMNALDAASLGLSAPPPEHPTVIGAVVDVPASGGFVTFVAIGDGTVSMYTSTGGGMIGAGGHATVAESAHRLLATVETQLDQLHASDETTHPAPGLVRVFALTPTGRRVADAPEDAFWGRAPHPLVPVFVGVQQLLTAMRQAQPPDSAPPR